MRDFHTQEGLRLIVLHRQLSSRLVTSLCALMVLLTVPSIAQTDARGALLLLRTQAASIAEECWPRLSDSATSNMAVKLSVEGGVVRSVVENAFLDYLGGHGVAIFSGEHANDSYHVVELSILEQAVRYRSIADEEYQREVRTVVEARRTHRSSGNRVYAGVYQRTNVDTVKSREDFGVRNLTQGSEMSLFDRIVGPLVLIGSTFLVVYLFFTVRN